MANYITHIESGTKWFECICKKSMILDETYTLINGNKYLVSKYMRGFVKIKGTFSRFTFTQHPFRVKSEAIVYAKNLKNYLDYCFQ